MSGPGLLELPAAEVAQIARGLYITDFDSGARIPWEPTAIQRSVWEARERHHRLFVTKPRRAYVSTAFDLDDALFAAVNDAAGERVRVGVALDTDDHVAERVWQMSSFLKQLGVPHRDTDGLIELQRAESQVAVFTAGGKRAAASTGLQRVRYSEAAHYKAGQIGTISAAAGKQAQEMIETTIGAHAENFLETRSRWREQGAWRPYHRLFIPFEMHQEYRAPAELLKDGEWEWALKEGFTLPEAAAYFLREVLPKFGGDMLRALGEYPQTEEHMFQLGTGRWVSKTPTTKQPIDRVPVLTTAGDIVYLLIYRDPRMTNGDVTIGVDTATGKDKDRCAIAGVDNADRNLVCAFVDGKIHGDDFAKVVRAAVQYFTVDVDGKTTRPSVYVEDNTVGQITIQPLQKMGVSFHTFDTTEDSKYRGLLEAKRAVETGAFAGPPDLAEECDELHRDEHGRWKGRKDLLMAYGFAALRIAANPSNIGPVDRRGDLHESRIQMGKRLIRARAASERGRWW